MPHHSGRKFFNKLPNDLRINYTNIGNDSKIILKELLSYKILLFTSIIFRMKIKNVYRTNIKSL